jgi:hypothetical protein
MTDKQLGLGVAIVLAAFGPCLIYILIELIHRKENPINTLLHRLDLLIHRTVTINPDKINWEGSREFGKFALHVTKRGRIKALIIWDMINHDMKYISHTDPQDTIAEFMNLYSDYVDYHRSDYQVIL